MKKIQKLLSIVLALILALSVLTLAGVNAAAYEQDSGSHYLLPTGETLATAARFALFATQIGNIAMGLSGAVTGGIQTSYNYDSAEAGAEVKDVNRYMAILQQMLDESEEELQQILDQIQALFNQLVAIVQSKTDTGNIIVQNMSQMV